jgi:hypothetical protein
MATPGSDFVDQSGDVSGMLIEKGIEPYCERFSIGSIADPSMSGEGLARLETA